MRRCESFTELFLSNIMKYGKNDIKGQTSIQGISISDILDYLRKEEGSFNLFFIQPSEAGVLPHIKC